MPTTVYGVPIMEENAHDASDEDEELAASRENPHDGDALRQHDDPEEETGEHGEEDEDILGKHYYAKVMQLACAGSFPWTPNWFSKI